jgi:hypothetical protein
LFGEASAAMITELPQAAVKLLFESLKRGLTNLKPVNRPDGRPA